MKVDVLKKKIWLNKNQTKWCWCYVFKHKIDMQDWYKKYCDSRNSSDRYHYKVKGVSIHYYRIKGKLLHKNTGIVLLNYEDGCGAGIVSHEFNHAVLFANQHHRTKERYPIVIKDMNEEEKILHNHTYAVIQFYDWFWKIVNKKFK